MGGSRLSIGEKQFTQKNKTKKKKKKAVSENKD